MINRRDAVACLLALSGLVGAGDAPAQAPADSDAVLRVCADPNNPPLSDRSLSGFENKIAALIARELGWKLEYAWWPQRMGFVRNTLRARDPEHDDRYKCDLVIGVGFPSEITASTRPYYRSTWVAVFRKGVGLDDVKTADDFLKIEPARLKSLRFGYFAGTPPTDWLLEHHLFDQGTFYPPQSGDPTVYPGQIIDRELMSGRIDVAFAWGPIAGYYARNSHSPELLLAPFPPDKDKEHHFDFPIAMGMRFGEKAWRDRIDALVAGKKAEIDAILGTYGVPLVDEEGRVLPLTAAN